MSEATEIILNPKGNHGRDGRNWISCQRTCLRELAPADVTVVESIDEAAQAARQSALKGYRKIVSVGAPETAHGVVNGVMSLAESHRHQIKLGLLSFSRPDQWSRTLGLPRDLTRQLEILSAGHTLPFDVGQVECHDEAGERTSRYFLNGAWFGLVGQWREEWRSPHSNLMETLPRLAGTLRNAVSPARSRVRLESQGALLYEGPLAQAMVMGGRYYPSFGQVAPQADPSDGLLDLAWIESGTVWDLALTLGRLWVPALRGQKPRLPWQTVEHLRATALDTPLAVEADGQPVGRLPAHITVARRALPVMVAPVAVKLKKPEFAPVREMNGRKLAGNVKSAVGL